jgi:four helix bundle protein
MRSGKIDRFEELIAWQKARELAREIYSVTKQGAFGKDRALADQIRRAAVSVMSNIAEGFERGARAEFHKFLVISKGSCAEVRSQLYVALDVGYVDESQFKKLCALASETARVIGGLRSAVEKQRNEKG